MDEPARDLDAVLQRAVDCRHWGRMEEARSLCLEVLRREPGHAMARQLLDALRGEPEKPPPLQPIAYRSADTESIEMCRRILAAEPGNASARFVLSALTGETPERPPEDFVRHLFDKYSTRYDRHMTESLEYKVPARMGGIAGGLARANGGPFAFALDMGCGTGLCGEALRPFVQRLLGIDMSAKMLARCREKKIYDALYVTGLVEYLTDTDVRFDLLAAADVFPYLGKLEPLFDALTRCVNAGGYFIFSVEHADSGSFALGEAGRYAHSTPYVRELAAARHFSVDQAIPAELRKDRGKWVEGRIFTLCRQPQAARS